VNVSVAQYAESFHKVSETLTHLTSLQNDCTSTHSKALFLGWCKWMNQGVPPSFWRLAVIYSQHGLGGEKCFRPDFHLLLSLHYVHFMRTPKTSKKHEKYIKKR